MGFGCASAVKLSWLTMLPMRCVRCETGHGMLGEFAAERAGNAAVAVACSALLAHAKLAAPEDPDDLEASHVEGILHEAFEAGHAAALDLYKDPPRNYSYPTSLR